MSNLGRSKYYHTPLKRQSEYCVVGVKGENYGSSRDV